jgi:hypothetical protein
MVLNLLLQHQLQLQVELLLQPEVMPLMKKLNLLWF